MTVVTNATRGQVLAQSAEVAVGPWQQFIGLMGRPHLPQDGGLVLPRTRGVHTHFMRFPIDVAFYDGDGVVVGVERALIPWRFSAYHWRAKGAVELTIGTLRTSGTVAGDVLTFSESQHATNHNPGLYIGLTADQRRMQCFTLAEYGRETHLSILFSGGLEKPDAIAFSLFGGHNRCDRLESCVIVAIQRGGEQSGSCAFQNGFEVMRDALGDEIIGDCRGNEQLNPNIGRVEQLTTTGVLYWRTCDNLTIFSDSAIVWFNTP